MASSKSIQVSAEEKRYLRSFFRRQALPYIVAMGIAAWVAIATTQPPDAADFTAGLNVVRAENEALRSDLAETRRLIAREISALDGEVERLSESVASIDASTRRLATTAGGGRAKQAKSSGVSSSQLAAALARLEALERPQGGGRDLARETFEKDVLNRLYNVEAGHDRAASTRAEIEGWLERLDVLERRFFELETRVVRNGGADVTPAAPGP